jgi:hypothetical protein
LPRPFVKLGPPANKPALQAKGWEPALRKAEGASVSSVSSSAIDLRHRPQCFQANAA